jgi:hypothetical protein
MFEVQPRPVKGPPVRGLAALLIVAFLFVATGAVAFAAGPLQVGQGPSADPSAPAAPPSPGASTVPGTKPALTEPGQCGMNPGFGWGRRLFGRGGPGGMGEGGRIIRGFPGFPVRPGGHGGRVPGAGFIGRFLGDVADARTIRITAIDGNNLSLVTNDGWTRTIDASKATVTRDCAASSVADLKVGDTIRLRQQPNDDGTWSVIAINVVQPRVGGTVQSVGTDSITLSHIDGSTTVLHVSGATVYRVIGVDNGTLADIKPGNLVAAAGTLRDDGSLDATAIVAFNGSLDGSPRGPWGGGSEIWPDASPSPSAPAANG